VTDATPPDTRARILRVALDEFSARGYHATSIREIAERVGVTKTAVLYHFPGKVDILDALAKPMLDDLEAALAVADLTDPARARWVAIEGILRVWLTHRYLIRMNLRDTAMVGSDRLFDRFRDAMLRANVMVAGEAPDFAERVRAAQAIAMLSDPVVLFADAPTEALRAAVLQGVRRLLDGADPAGTAEPAGTGRTRTRRGRPSTMDGAMTATARRMYDSGSGVDEIAAALGVSRATVYRHLPGTVE
jgi:AcrR family transcriptional regulator